MANGFKHNQGHTATQGRATDAPILRVLNLLERAGCRPRRVGARWIAHCPMHGDRNASLSLGVGRDDRILVRCWAGCATGAVRLRWANKEGTTTQQITDAVREYLARVKKGKKS